jgi:hypothetical protein
MVGSSWVSAKLMVSQEGLLSIKLFRDKSNRIPHFQITIFEFHYSFTNKIDIPEKTYFYSDKM